VRRDKYNPGMPRKKTPEQELTIVIPVYNEAAALPHFLPNLMTICKTKDWQVIFVDDGSTDLSAQILAGIEAKPFTKVLHHKLNKGYGGALKTGISAATTKYVMTLDADGQHDIADIESLLDFAHKTNADMVVGTRSVKHASPYRELGKWIIRRFTSILVPLPVQDLNSGFKLYQTRLVQQYLSLCPDSMAFSDVITLLFLNQRHLVLEHPISVRHRTTGSSSISTHTAFQTVIEILSLVMLVNPLRIFLPLSIICIAVGLLWGIPSMLAGRGVSVGSMLAIVLGALFFFLGLIANQLSSIRLHLAEMGKDKDLD
jgi:glycosyltransferase involved in cell wall biosynthesis